MTWKLLAAVSTLAANAVAQQWHLNPANHHGYTVVSENTWSGAQAAAGRLGGHLVIINDAAEQAWLFDTFSSSTDDRFGPWIGLVQDPGGSEPSGGWAWFDGSPLNYSNWDPGSPDDGGQTDENAAVIYLYAGGGPGTWDDKDSARLQHGLVERSAAPFLAADTTVLPEIAPSGSMLLVRFHVSNPTADDLPLFLGASIRPVSGGDYTESTECEGCDSDAVVVVPAESNGFYERCFVVSDGLAEGLYEVTYAIWHPEGADCGPVFGAEPYDILVRDDLTIVPASFLQIISPDSDTVRRQDDVLSISWLDDGQAGTQIRLFFDPDTGPEPWDEGGVSNQIAIPISIDASNRNDDITWHVADLEPGTYSVWGDSNNGVDPPTYSRAPGLVTVTEFTDDTEPIVDQSRLDLGSLPSPVFVRQADTPQNLYLVTHGWNGFLGDADHSWIQDIAGAVDAQLNGDEWDVAYFDWTEFAGGAFRGPGYAADWAMMLGNLLGEQIDTLGYTHVEVVAHSAGSWLADAIAFQVASGETVNLTLLDAYAWFYRDQLGIYADHVVNCYDDSVTVPLTQENLPHAFNVDMTCRRENGDLPRRDETPRYDGSSHGAPWEWYRLSTHQTGWGEFMDDETRTHNGQPAPLGFKMSKAYTGINSGWDGEMTRYSANNDSEFNVCGGLWQGCDADTTVFVEYADTFDFTSLVRTIGPDGTVTVAPDSVELTTGAENAWVGFDVPMPRAVSAVLFDVEFTSADPDAEGYATGYWNGLQLTSADERFTGGSDPGSRSFTFLDTVASGEKVISLRLDKNGGPTSSVLVSNLRYGINLDVDINGDCMATADDFCSWIADPFDLDGNGVVDADDQRLLEAALGVSGADDNGDGVPDLCEGCAPDLNDDGLVNTQDFLIFLNAWAGGDHFADWNADGRVDTLDFLAFLNDWAAGC